MSTAIRVAAQWYRKHLGSQVRILLITNDRENKNKALKDGTPVDTASI
ncbi:hypothetical protein OROGR_017958 [Orobanche gracilis]